MNLHGNRPREAELTTIGALRAADRRSRAAARLRDAAMPFLDRGICARGDYLRGRGRRDTLAGCRLRRASLPCSSKKGARWRAACCLLLSMCLYARFVVLDAKGLITIQPEKAAEPVAKESRGLFGRKTKIDAAHASVRPAAKRSDLETVAVRNSDEEDEDEDTDDEDEDGEETQAAHKLSNPSEESPPPARTPAQQRLG